jgi:diaminopimelate decarboxylase
VSRGEIDLARRAGIAPRNIVLEGIGKSDADLRVAASLATENTPLAWVSLESVEDAEALAVAAKRAGVKVEVLVRVNPQVAPDTHPGLAVGAPDSKFGVLPQELGDVMDAGGGARGALRWRGIHLHIGSQLHTIDAWRVAARAGLRILQLQRGALRNFDTINFGGGFPVAYGGAAGSVPTAAQFAAAVQAEIDELPANARPARVAVEPGRAVVAASGWLIARVLHVRRREQDVVVIDAGMTELIRPALYNVLHPMIALTSLGRPVVGAGVAAPTLMRVDGAICESTDTFGSSEMPPLQRGDFVAIGVVGAYGSSMFSSYNGRPRPPEIAWDGAHLHVWRRRGSARALP